MAGLLGRLFRRQRTPELRCSAVVPAAGSSTRMEGQDKLLLPLEEQPVLLHTLRALELCPYLAEIIVVTREDLILQISELCREMDKVKAVVKGGGSRQESVWLGLNALSKDMELAAIQDGARPLITPALIDKTVRAAHSYGAAAPAVPVKDTIKIEKSGLIESTPDRSTLRAVQTPQVFDFDLLRGALQKAASDKAAVTDDCSAVERLGMKIRLVAGDERNLKVTTPLDLKIAELLLEEGQ